MQLSDQQIDLLKKCEDGLNYYSISEKEQTDLMWLAQTGYCKSYHGTFEPI